MHRTSAFRFPLILSLVFASTVLHAQSDGRLSERIQLFGGETAPPVLLESDRDWIPIAAFDWSEAGIAPPPDGESRRWRLETSYEHGWSSGPATVQIRLRGAGADPVFTHPWSEGADRMANAYSNWFEDNGLLSGSGKGYVEARLIAPPRTPLTGRLYAVSIEAWDILADGPHNTGPAGPDVQLAYARPLPTGRPTPAGRADEDAVDPNQGLRAATEFSLSFVESCLTGDLPSYYRAQADPVRSLDDGKAMPRYRLNPPRSIPGIVDLESYRKRFDYSVHSVKDFADLFPEWFDEDRPWVPGENAFLFMGHKDRHSGAFPEGVDYLVFLVEPDGDGKWKVTARPAER